MSDTNCSISAIGQILDIPVFAYTPSERPVLELKLSFINTKQLNLALKVVMLDDMALHYKTKLRLDDWLSIYGFFNIDEDNTQPTVFPCAVDIIKPLKPWHRLTTIGRLVKDAESFDFKENKPIIKFPVAVNQKDKASYYNVSVFDQPRWLTLSTFTKGTYVFLDGRLSARKSKDKLYTDLVAHYGMVQSKEPPK